jgi:hypothetical protein
MAAWSLQDWASQPALGAEFKEVNGVPRVVTVDPGSPAWEAGLKEGDEIRLLQIEGVDFIFDPDGKAHRNDRATAERLKTLTSDVRRCLAKLSDVTPGKEYLFGMKRGDKFVYAVTRVKQRPLWRFFATRPDRGNDWVLWGWRDYFYDTSTHGDRYVGWVVCDERDTLRPDFYRADQFAKRFYDRDKVQQLLEGARANPDEVAVPRLEPPAVAVLADSDDLNARDAVVTFTATARDDSNLQKLDEARLWVNDHLFKTWPAVNAATFDSGRVVIPQDQLRLGDNVIVLHCFNAAGARAELAVRVHFQDPKRPRKPNLYGLAVGVNVYKDRVKAPGITNLACAEQDAQAFRELWSPQAKNRYDQVDVRLLAEEKATRANILAVLDDFKKLQAKGDLRPDDTLVLFFAGHGLSLRDDKGRYKPGSYVYVCPGFNAERPMETGLDSKTLYKGLSELNCRKLVFLDSCHAGAMDPVRDLRSDGMGPFVLASCLPHETSGEVPEIGHGFFTQVLLDGLGDGLEADANEDGNVDIRELCDYVKRYVPNLATRNKKKGSQNPQYSPQMPGREVLVSRVKDS